MLVVAVSTSTLNIAVTNCEETKYCGSLKIRPKSLSSDWLRSVREIIADLTTTFLNNNAIIG